MKNILFIITVFISNYAVCQTYNYKPNWNEGDVKKVSITTIEKEYENDELITDTLYNNEAKFTVLKDSKNDYTLEVLFENQALKSVISFYDKLGEELEDYKNLKLIYKIDKESGKSDLQNWEEAQEFMNSSFDQITVILEDKTPEIAPMLGLVFMPIKEAFKSKEGIEGYMEQNISYLTIPFGKDYEIGKVISNTETGENPFNPSQEMSSTTLLSLESINESNKLAIIKKEVQFDLTELIEMIKSMVMGMGESFGANDSIMKKKSEEMDDFEMDIKNIEEIYFNYETTWVSKVITKGIVTGTEPRDGTKTRKEVITTTLVE